MTAPQPAPAPRASYPLFRWAPGTSPASRVLLVLAFAFAIAATLVAAGVITFSGGNWLIPASLASFFLAWIV